MSSLQAFFDEHNSRDIHTLGQFIQAHIDAQWDVVFRAIHTELIDLYPKIGEGVYGVYGQRLFKPIHDQFKVLGVKATPKLPGSLPISREWGETDDERQRWMWSKITTADGEALGTIVSVFWHDHTQIRIPRPTQIITLEETTKGDVIRALSKRSREFSEALDANEEYAEYLRSLES